jgi:hypothetical protein
MDHCDPAASSSSVGKTHASSTGDSDGDVCALPTSRMQSDCAPTPRRTRQRVSNQLAAPRRRDVMRWHAT